MKALKYLLIMLSVSMTFIYAGSKVNLNAPAPDDMSAYYSAATQDVETLKKKIIVANPFWACAKSYRPEERAERPPAAALLFYPGGYYHHP